MTPNTFAIIETNTYTGHWGVVEISGGIKFLHFCSRDKAVCEQWLADHLQK